MVSNHRTRTDKPHIFFSMGFWRVTPAGRGTTKKKHIPWQDVHAKIWRWNLPHSNQERLLMAWEYLDDNCD